MIYRYTRRVFQIILLLLLRRIHISVCKLFDTTNENILMFRSKFRKKKRKTRMLMSDMSTF